MNQFEKYENILQNAGLSEKEIKIYWSILEKGQVGIGDILKSSKIKRGDLYNVLYSLRDKGLLEQTIKRGKIQFRMRDPYNLLNLAVERRDKAAEEYGLISSIIPALYEKFSINFDKPGVTVKEGVEAVDDIFQMVLNSGAKKMYLFRSIYDRKNETHLNYVRAFRKKRAQLGIATRALTPFDEKAFHNYLFYDKPRFIERRFLPMGKFKLQSEIYLWKDFVAIIALKREPIITLIENKDIASTFLTIFQLIWDLSEKGHKDLIKKYKTIFTKREKSAIENSLV